jgi:hypothetical protein
MSHYEQDFATAHEFRQRYILAAMTRKGPF